MVLYKSNMGSILDDRPAKEMLDEVVPSTEEVLNLLEITPQQRWKMKNAVHVRAKQREYQKAYRLRKRDGR